MQNTLILNSIFTWLPSSILKKQTIKFKMNKIRAFNKKKGNFLDITNNGKIRPNYQKIEKKINCKKYLQD